MQFKCFNLPMCNIFIFVFAKCSVVKSLEGFVATFKVFFMKIFSNEIAELSNVTPPCDFIQIYFFKLNLRIVFVFHLPDFDVNNFKMMINCELPSNIYLRMHL